MGNGPIRLDLYVVARFLDVLGPSRNGTPPKEWTRSRLQAATRLNYDIFRKYLDRLLEKGLIVERENVEEKPVYVLTAEGKEAHERIVGWVREFIGGRP